MKIFAETAQPPQLAKKLGVKEENILFWDPSTVFNNIPFIIITAPAHFITKA